MSTHTLALYVTPRVLSLKRVLLCLVHAAVLDFCVGLDTEFSELIDGRYGFPRLMTPKDLANQLLTLHVTVLAMPATSTFLLLTWTM